MDNPIVFWYGPVQRFGGLGRCQRWLNILGNIADSGHLVVATFSLNGAPERSLVLGSDQHRLAAPGDFNVQLGWDEVLPGDNSLVVRVQHEQGRSHCAAVRLVVEDEDGWPLPYEVDFTVVQNLQDVVQIVDGLWKLQDDGVRTVVPYYDRVLSMGDESWTNYETTVRLTIQGFTPSQPGPPTYDVTHFGVAMRWRGHHPDQWAPNRKWYPLGAQGEFLLKDDLEACQWRILFDDPKQKPPQYARGLNKLVLGQPLRVKTQIVTLPDGRSRYRFKQWPEDAPEPLAWDIEGFEEDDYSSGALCLVPHNADFTIHGVRVERLVSP